MKNVAQVGIVPNIQTQFGESVKLPLIRCLPENNCIWFRDASYCGEVFAVTTKMPLPGMT